MAGLVPAIHAFSRHAWKDVDARHKAGHDDVQRSSLHKKKRPAQTDRSFSTQSTARDQSFLFAAAAARFTASLVASLASPSAFWPLPLASWIAPSPCSRSEPVASPIPCLALPMASLVAPFTLSVVLPMELSCCELPGLSH